MCTRFFIEKDTPILIQVKEKAELSPLYNKFCIHQGKSITTSGEVKPTDIVPVLAPDKSGKCAVYPMRWGFHMADGTPLFNARSETAAVKPFFKEDWLRHRCIIPASFYFEWQHIKNEIGKSVKTESAVKYAIQPVDSSVTWLCGLYRIENGFPYFVILTRDSVGDLRKIHDRMPVLLPKSDIEKWISPETDPSEMLSHALVDVVFERQA